MSKAGKEMQRSNDRLIKYLEPGETSCDSFSTSEGSNTGSLDKETQQRQEGLCDECEDQPFSGYCVQCQDQFCEICFQYLHRRGKRKNHEFQKYQENASHLPPDPQTKILEPDRDDLADLDGSDVNGYAKSSLEDRKIDKGAKAKNASNFIEKSKYILLRLNSEERESLRLLEATLNVSDYTYKVDLLPKRNQMQRISTQIKLICSVLSGLLIAKDYDRGKETLKDHNYVDNSEFFSTIFEIGRRYKVNNPDKMPDDYVKLMYMLQDSVIPHIQENLGFGLIKPLKSVYDFLNERQMLKLLEDPNLVYNATMDISSESRSGTNTRALCNQKERCREQLVRKYASNNISAEEIRLCLYSIGDYNSFMRSQRDPCRKMLEYLKTYFQPDDWEEPYALSIRSGKSGARLSHDHRSQYYYVLQSITLWENILDQMPMLWYLAEQDLVDPQNRYELSNTGQGLNRLQQSPRLFCAIRKLVNRLQNEIGGHWIGSSVIHLGDHNVPNSLFFLTKYLSASPMLNPIILCIEGIDRLIKNKKLSTYLNVKADSEKIKKDILCDFFKHAFDGSGSDNFFDAGSCIDGRLTSAWNWCNEIEKKPYFYIFLLTGFVGFNG